MQRKNAVMKRLSLGQKIRRWDFFQRRRKQGVHIGGYPARRNQMLRDRGGKVGVLARLHTEERQQRSCRGEDGAP